MIENYRWDYCGLCCCPYIKCRYCNNTSCSGGGCNKCQDEFKEAIKIASGPEEEWPPFTEEYKREKENHHNRTLKRLLKDE